jgi:cytochrome c-type protein NapB
VWILLTAFIGGVAVASTADGVDLTQSPEVSGTAGANIAIPKQQPRMVLEYVNQPPMVPHSVDGYQVSTNFNACLNCHSVQASRSTGAARISPTHFMDASGKTLGHVAPRRYFCLQCHVPQANVAPIVENNFKPVPGFGQ